VQVVSIDSYEDAKLRLLSMETPKVKQLKIYELDCCLSMNMSDLAQHFLT
jgi:glutaminase